jgi:hypothetical protein
MVKKLLLIIPVFALLLTLGFNNGASAASAESVSNEASTQYSPQNKGEVSTKAIDIENGFIACMAYSGRADCNWHIRISGDIFVYNGVRIDIQKNYGWLNGGWKNYTSYQYNYAISESASITTLRNTKTFTLPKGEYRARLGGTFITAEHGTYTPIGYDWANFTVN